jgi:intergrase/recombinase
LSNPQFWESFKEYLQGFNNKKTIYSRLSYAKRYYKLLLSENLNEIIDVKKDKKSHIMKALASLSKYLGIYDKWKKLVEKYNLKWTNRSSLDTFYKIINSNENIEQLIKWIKNFINNKEIGIEYRNLVIYCTLTGLRISEALESIKIIKDKDKVDRYFEPERNILKHYEFPDIFIRKTKKAFFSVVNNDIIKFALTSITSNYSSIQSFFYRKKIDFKVNYCRKVFATYLRNGGIEQEIIDLLQGRISNTVFVNHYYRPDINEMITNKIGPVLQSLLQILIHN